MSLLHIRGVTYAPKVSVPELEDKRRTGHRHDIKSSWKEAWDRFKARGVAGDSLESGYEKILARIKVGYSRKEQRLEGKSAYLWEVGSLPFLQMARWSARFHLPYRRSHN